MEDMQNDSSAPASVDSSPSARSALSPSRLAVRVSDDHGIVAVLTPAGWRDVAGGGFGRLSTEALDAFAQGRTRGLTVRGIASVNPRTIVVNL